jgi:hypothetical protein
MVDQLLDCQIHSHVRFNSMNRPPSVRRRIASKRVVTRPNHSRYAVIGVAVLAVISTAYFVKRSQTDDSAWNVKRDSTSGSAWKVNGAPASAPPERSNSTAFFTSASDFRIAASRGMAGACDGYFGSDPGMKAIRSRINQTKYQHLWPYFFSGSLMLSGRSSSSAPIIAFYNPYVDAAFLTQWSTTPEPRITRATVVIGSGLSSGNAVATVGGLPRWTSGSPSVAGGLLDGFSDFTAAFAALHPKFDQKSVPLNATDAEETAWKTIEQRSLSMTRELAKLGSGGATGNNSRTVVRDLIKLLGKPTEEQIKDLLPDANQNQAKAVAAIGQPILSRMRPTLFLATNAGAIAFLIDAGSPEKLLVAHIGPTSSGNSSSLGLLSLLPLQF